MNPLSETVWHSAVGDKSNTMAIFFKAIREFLPLKLVVLWDAVQVSWQYDCEIWYHHQNINE